MCKVKVLNGEYDQELVRSHDALSDEELANGYALACYMTPKSDLVLKLHHSINGSLHLFIFAKISMDIVHF